MAIQPDYVANWSIPNVLSELMMSGDLFLNLLHKTNNNILLAASHYFILSAERLDSLF